MADFAAIIEDCFQAFDHAAREQYEKDGFKDCGTCGGMMLGYRGNTRFARALVATGRACRMGGKVYVGSALPVATQHAEVEIKAMQAFMETARSRGIEPAKWWTYVD